MKLPLISTMLLLACNSTPIDKEAEGKKIIQLSKEWAEVVATHNVEKTVGYWAQNAVLMAPGQPVLNGSESIRNMVEESFKIPGFNISWEPQSVVVSESGDLAYMIEKSQVSFPDSTGKTITQTNNAVSIWSKQSDGSWKNVVEISTPVNLP
jgi:uncharacterized protein (TIGR02246 family)